VAFTSCRFGKAALLVGHRPAVAVRTPEAGHVRGTPFAGGFADRSVAPEVWQKRWLRLAEITRAEDGSSGTTHSEAATYDGAAESLQTVWMAVRASLRAVLENITTLTS